MSARCCDGQCRQGRDCPAQGWMCRPPAGEACSELGQDDDHTNPHAVDWPLMLGVIFAVAAAVVLGCRLGDAA